MIPNLYIGNGCFTKHLLKSGCLWFQVDVFFGLQAYLHGNMPKDPWCSWFDLSKRKPGWFEGCFPDGNYLTYQQFAYLVYRAKLRMKLRHVESLALWVVKFIQSPWLQMWIFEFQNHPGRLFSDSRISNHPCMVYFPTFTIIYHKEKPNVYNKYTAKTSVLPATPREHSTGSSKKVGFWGREVDRFAWELGPWPNSLSNPKP